MPGVTEPGTGLVFYELSHVWGHNVPTLPGFADVVMYRSSTHAKNGVLANRMRTIMHTGTHVNAPVHLIQKSAAIGDIPLEHFFGSGVIVSIPKKEWELVTAEELAAAKPAIEEDDIVVIVTGWHHKYSDGIEYFGHGPGLSKAAAEWLVQKKVKLVAVDTPFVDHPMATSMGPHRNGPQMKRVPKAYEAAKGRPAIQDFPEWNAAHRTLLAAGIPTIEQAGGDVDDVLGKRCTFQCMPWNWHEGDACQVRLVAILNPQDNYRIEPGVAR